MDKHIETLNFMESSYAHIRKNDSEFEAIEAAKEALQEQAEREKGCDFCCYTEYPDKTLYPKEGYLFYAGYSKQTAPDDFYEEEVEDINFCPVCGRRLK